MITNIRTEVKTNAAVPFWHTLPEVLSWCPAYEASMISAGKMVSCNNTISPDGLTFTRVSVFNNMEDQNYVVQNAPDPTYVTKRNTYADNNGITHSRVVQTS